MPAEHPKAATLDLSRGPCARRPTGCRCLCARKQDHQLERTLDAKLIEACRPALEEGAQVRGSWPVANSNRAVGTMLGSEVTRRYGGAGLPPGTIELELTGSAGQSFGAFLPAGHHAALVRRRQRLPGQGPFRGPDNRAAAQFDVPAGFVAEANIIAGNVIGYGATSGEIFIRGVVGERFCVRNSGALAVVEGVGDHGCEYMTGGRVVVLGPTGRNFAAGMSGGFAYVYDPHGRLADRLNHEMVELEAPGRRRQPSGSRTCSCVTPAETASAVAETAAWQAPGASASSFVKVVPTDYRRALEAARLCGGGARGRLAAIMMAAAHG